MSVPTFTPGAGAGSGATATILKGGNQSGVLQLVPGTNPSPGAALGTMSFGQAFGVAPVAVLMTPANADAVGLAMFADPASYDKTGFTVFGTVKTASAAGFLIAYLVKLPD